ncbi:MAG TPA: ThiF family adenylyltransferase [Candidatus Binatia bacterium]|nr:ThiF family adenylyltransferase [Candidatus Binatia bacterium]
MSDSPINLSPDLARLKSEGYEIEIVAGHLVIRNVPYVNCKKEVRRGALVSELSLAGNVTVRPNTHVVMFAGELPCDKTGQELHRIINDKTSKNIGQDLTINYTFSSKPPGGYPDYHQKMTAYVAILSSHAQAIDPDATAQTWRVIANNDPDSPFHYLDTASSRAGIAAASRKLEQYQSIAILGLGGTGSYVLDLVAKTPVPKIHLFDKDKYGQHNAFRSPGAPSIEELRAIPYKVDHWHSVYSRMHRGIVPHTFNIEASNVELLRDMGFVFVCADAGTAKAPIVEKLEELGIPFADTGMGLDLVDERLHGILTVTTSTKEKRDHFRRRVSFAGDGHENIYAKNIQVADLNALNAALAVIKWKKLCGFYADYAREHFTAYTIDGNTLVNEDRAGAGENS